MPEIRATTILNQRGDTVALPCRQPDCTGPERIRILNIDAPETRGAACEAELVKGLDAKAALSALLRGRSITLRRCEPDTGRCADRYGRTWPRSPARPAISATR